MIHNTIELTPVEIKMLLILKEGCNNKTISERANISVNTVKFHLKKIYKKLGAKNRIEAINKFNAILTYKTLTQ